MWRRSDNVISCLGTLWPLFRRFIHSSDRIAWRHRNCIIKIWPCDHLSSYDCLEAEQTLKWSLRCVRCRYRFTSAQDSVRHHKDNGKVHAIQCLKCNTVNSSAEKILQHELEESSSFQALLNRLCVQLCVRVASWRRWRRREVLTLCNTSPKIMIVFKKGCWINVLF